MARIRSQHHRRGAIIPLTALMIAVFIGMVAFAVDTNWMVMTKAELQNSADASALAGAQQLVANYPLYSATGQSATNKAALASAAVANARSVAKTYGQANGAGGKTTLTYLDSDIDVGFTAADGTFTSYSSTGTGNAGNYPNTVKVRSRRDDSANTKLNLFFGAVLGTSSVAMSTPATATLYTGTVTSFTPPATGNVPMLPFTYDVNHWKNFVATGKDPDGNTTYDKNGNPEIQVYPSLKYTGNFGQLSLNDSNVGDSVMKNWVQNGMSASDVNALTSAGLIPLSSHDPTKWDWQGSTGFEQSLISYVNNYQGQTSWIPLFQPVNSSQTSYQAGVGTGSGYSYNVVAFVPVRIVAPANNSNNNDHKVFLQSVSVIDSSAVFSPGSIVPAGTATGTTANFASVLAPRLSN